MSWDSRYYVANLLNRTSKELNIDFWVDYICFDPREMCPLSEAASWCVSNEEGSVVYIPKVLKKDKKEVLRNLAFHEAAHSFLWHHPRAFSYKYLHDAFGKFVDENYFIYRIKAFFHYFKERRPGYCSGYAMTSPEEDFAETFSFVLSNRNKNNWFYGGELIDYKSDPRLHRKVKAIKRLLRL